MYKNLVFVLVGIPQYVSDRDPGGARPILPVVFPPHGLPNVPNGSGKTPSKKST